MLRLLNEVSPWLLAIGIVAIAEAYSIGLMLLCRKRWGSDRLALNNEVAGFKFAVVGVFYAVLLAFVVVAVWENYRDTETAVRNEAKALADLHQVSYALSEDAGGKMRKHYGHISAEGPRRGMAGDGAGSRDKSAEDELQHLGRALFGGSAKQLKDVALYHHAIDLMTSSMTIATSGWTAPTALFQPRFGSCCWRVR